MSDVLAFQDTKDNIIKRGNRDGQGMIYCGKKFTSKDYCPCLGCNGICGPNNGCACPECEYTLSFALYITGEMNCPICKNMLLRFNIFNLRNITKKDSFICNNCNNSYSAPYIRIMRCMNCDYNLCQNCAFSKLNENNVKPFSHEMIQGVLYGEGMLYCGKKYVEYHKCVCGTCDGSCGKKDGCPCPICEIILGYNLYLSNDFKCKRCNDDTILVKTNLFKIQKYKTGYEYGYTCNCCKKIFNQIFNSVLHCFKCNYDICQICAFDFIKNKPLLYPKLPKMKLIIDLQNGFKRLFHANDEKNDKK